MPTPTHGPQDALAELLVRRLTNSFGLLRDDAEEIVRDARLCLVAAGNVSDAKTWLIETVCRSARRYWRRDLPPDAVAAEMSAIRDAAFTGAALATLSPSMLQAVRLRYHDGRSWSEIAEEMAISTPYAQRLVVNALKALARAGERS